MKKELRTIYISTGWLRIIRLNLLPVASLLLLASGTVQAGVPEAWPYWPEYQKIPFSQISAEPHLHAHRNFSKCLEIDSTN